ncbi:hypothetical protein [uncultured Desulfosarcina sp.]|uniref:hypothetical protein n=1 Tax=uncultured Desulfosarcina sp. TaxID=218289 RepID=UPI0029C70B50|nr:hypothetical protein [uncultured Desulfosarcina sp.]
MPIKYTVDRTQNLTVFDLTGEVPFSELIDAIDEYGKNDPTLYEIYDTREIGGNRLTTAEIQKLAVYLKSHADRRPLGSKTAVVVNNEIDFGLSRMISSLTDQEVPYKIEVFRTMNKAHQWLDEP